MSLLPVHDRSSFGNFVRATSVTPINDLKGAKTSRFVEGEQLIRCKLAALYRLVDLCGWTHGIYNHISARVDDDNKHFLLNPFGMLYSEITASTLLKVDLQGNVIDQGTSQFGVNKAGFTLHSAIHEVRPDIQCIIHLHTSSAVAVSAMKCGLLPLCPESLMCGEVAYHDYQGIVIDENEKKTLGENLGKKKVIILRNHGTVACGESIEEAFHLTFNLLAACEAQVRAVPYGIDNIILPKDALESQANGDATSKGWKSGQLEFEALMRALDNLGYRTGYDYKLLPLKKFGP